MHALPAICLLLLNLWVCLAAVAWAIPTYLGGSLWGTIIFAPIAGAIGLWLSWKIIKTAVEAEILADR